MISPHLHELENAEVCRVGVGRRYRLVLHEEEAQYGKVAVEHELLICERKNQLFMNHDSQLLTFFRIDWALNYSAIEVSAIKRGSCACPLEAEHF